MRNSLGFEWTPERVERAAALRAEGKFIYEVASLLSQEWGTPLREAQVQGALRHRDKKLSGPPSPDGSGPRAGAVYELGGIEVLAVDGLTAPAHPEPQPVPQPTEKEKAADTMPAAPAPELPRPEAPRDPIAPAVHTGKSRAGNVLCISDPQEPYAIEDVVAFCRRVRAEFNIPKDNAVHMGDEADHLYGSRFPVDPDNEVGPLGELKWLRDRMKPWYAEYPKLRVCTSNHSDRWYKKAAGAQIPSQLIRARHEILEAPEGWVWGDFWEFRDGKMPWRAEHGHNGAINTRIRAIENGVSTAHGHFHAKAGVEWAHTAGGQLVWGLATGCLIDANAIAFKYNKRDRFKPIVGVGVVLDGGTKPLFVPYDR